MTRHDIPNWRKLATKEELDAERKYQRLRRLRLRTPMQKATSLIRDDGTRKDAK